MPVPGEDLHADLDGGWLLPAPAPREAVHTRSIVCRSFRREDGLVDVDGRFIDTRPYQYDSPWRGDCPPGSALHNMQLRLTLDRERRIVALVSATAPAEDLELLVRPDSLYVESIGGNVVPMERVFLHLILHARNRRKYL